MRATKASADFESKRMFDSDFFEFFSRIHPWQPPAIYLPLIAYATWAGLTGGAAPLPFLGMVFAGLLLWTLMEYWLHRVVFHFEAESALGKRIFWIAHGVHHDWPNDKYRLVFPPGVSLPLAAGFWAAFTYGLGDVHRYGAMAGLMAGYLSYDMIHYYTHHFVPEGRVGKYLRRYHLAHHHKEPDKGYGVSSPIWDYVFGTAPTRAPTRN